VKKIIWLTLNEKLVRETLSLAEEVNHTLRCTLSAPIGHPDQYRD
jgi:hypothetical protein